MLIEYKNVNVYQDDREVLRGVDFHVDEGEFIYIIGKVGTGKSSFLKTWTLTKKTPTRQRCWGAT